MFIAVAALITRVKLFNYLPHERLPSVKEFGRQQGLFFLYFFVTTPGDTRGSGEQTDLRNMRPRRGRDCFICFFYTHATPPESGRTFGISIETRLLTPERSENPYNQFHHPQRGRMWVKNISARRKITYAEKSSCNRRNLTAVIPVRVFHWLQTEQSRCLRPQHSL